MVEQIHPAVSFKESYPPRSLRWKLKRSCSKCSRCRYSVNGRGREADPFTDKISLCCYLAQVNQSLCQHAQISLENKSLNVPT